MANDNNRSRERVQYRTVSDDRPTCVYSDTSLLAKMLHKPEQDSGMKERKTTWTTIEYLTLATTKLSQTANKLSYSVLDPLLPKSTGCKLSKRNDPKRWSSAGGT